MYTEISGPKQNDLWGRVVAGVVLVIFLVGSVTGVFWSLLDPLPDNIATPFVEARQVREILVMIFAGGIGGLVYAIRAYWLHACKSKDFDRAYTPWYAFRVLFGSLLGFVFYFAVRGGIVFVRAESASEIELNIWSLAAIGALVGLFSEYAVEKLREVFIVSFAAKKDETSTE